MRARRFLILLAAIGGMLTVPIAAHADPEPTPTAGYPIEPPASAVSDATVDEGATVIFSGRGFLPYELITINISYQDSGAALHTTDHVNFFGAAGTEHVHFFGAAYRTIHATGAGTFAISVRLSQSGLATLTATGATSHITVTQQVHAVVSGSAGTLAVTGQSGRHWTTELAVGFGAILVGGLLALTAMRLRRRPTS